MRFPELNIIKEEEEIREREFNSNFVLPENNLNMNLRILELRVVYFYDF